MAGDDGKIGRQIFAEFGRVSKAADAINALGKTCDVESGEVIGDLGAGHFAEEENIVTDSVAGKFAKAIEAGAAADDDDGGGVRGGQVAARAG